jgi:hypothetical protein
LEREVRRLEGLGQLGFAFRTAEAGAIQSPPAEAGLFLDAKPCELFVGVAAAAPDDAKLRRKRNSPMPPLN